MNDVYLKASNLDKLKYSYIGEGSDAKVYKINKDILYKIYHTTSNTSIQNLFSDDIKIVNSKDDIIINDYKLPPLDYMDEFGIRIARDDAIKKARIKQEKIKLTQLPIGSIYINDHFRGCVIKNVNHAVPIHNIRILPFKRRLKIVSIIIDEVDELLNNNIYHIDLANKPDYNDIRKAHSNVLIKLKNLRPSIIDLDGISTIYRETYDSGLYFKSLYSLKVLIMQLLYDMESP